MSILAMVGVLIFFLVGTFVLTAASSAFRRLRRQKSKEELNALGDQLLYSKIHRWLFPSAPLDELLFAVFLSQNITRFSSGISVVFLLSKLGLFTSSVPILSQAGLINVVVLIGTVGMSLIVGDFIPRSWTRRFPQQVVNLCNPLASLFVVLCLPLIYPFLRLSQSSLSHSRTGEHDSNVIQVRDRIIELIEEASAENRIDQTDKKLIESAVTFRERIVREVMVPRVDVFALSTQTTVRDAAKMMAQQGFSRVPIYQGTLDQIVGILMYKDILAAYMECEDQGSENDALNAPVERFAKHVLYTPETKKVSDLLQEFRSTQMHIAIVVDEYGGTEGVVTIEDLLEEIVGDIADEYDQKEDFYTVESSGGWIVDARMTILDLEEQLGLKIPQDGEYDTVGGYVFHKAGTIPSKGLVIHHDDFELEILSSSDRCVERVRITPISSTEEEQAATQRPVNE